MIELWLHLWWTLWTFSHIYYIHNVKRKSQSQLLYYHFAWVCVKWWRALFYLLFWLNPLKYTLKTCLTFTHTWSTYLTCIFSTLQIFLKVCNFKPTVLKNHFTFPPMRFPKNLCKYNEIHTYIKSLNSFASTYLKSTYFYIQRDQARCTEFSRLKLWENNLDRTEST